LDLELELYFTVIFIYYNVWCTDVRVAVCQPFVKRIYDDDADLRLETDVTILSIPVPVTTDTWHCCFL